jgi:cellulose synthase/poly-beta-1,6-N-acetylglucosamine synthase-like glycosyltransferase
MAKPIFWITVLLLFYTYLGYPLLLLILPKKKRNIVLNNFSPEVSLVITVYNEEKAMAQKLENALQLDYPIERLEIIVTSDASTDATHEIVSSFKEKGVKLLSLKQRGGKTAAQKEAVKQAKGEILVFSDASTIIEKQALKNMIRNFRDENIGLVSGEDRWVSSENRNSSKGQKAYISYEMWIRNLESRVNSLVSASGCFYGVRKSLFIDIPNDLIDDMVIPLSVVEAGYKCVSEPWAIAIVPMVQSNQREYHRRVRMVVGGLRSFFYKLNLLNLFRYGFFSVQLVSHKLLRWAIPLFLSIMMVSNLFLLNAGVFYVFVILFQILFYLSASVGYIMLKMGYKARIFSVPYFYCLSNLAILRAWVRLILGEKKAIWEPSRR